MLPLSPFHTCDSSNKAPEKHHVHSLHDNSSCAAASLESGTANESSEKIYNTGPFTRRLRFCAALKTKKLFWPAALHHSAAALNEKANAVFVALSATCIKAAAGVCIHISFKDKQHAWHPHLLNNEVSHQQEPIMLLVRPLPCGPAALPLHRPASAAFNNDKSIGSIYPSSSHIHVVSQCSWEIDSTHKALNPGGSLKKKGKKKPKNWSVSLCFLPLFLYSKEKNNYIHL